MNHQRDRAPGAPVPAPEPEPDPARAALALAILDSAICPPGADNISELHRWLMLLEGIGGSLACSASTLETEASFLPGHLEALGDCVELAARVARVLADTVEVELRQLRARPT